MHEMRENDALTTLFRSRLSGTEMPVCKGFWEELERDLSRASSKRPVLLPSRLYRVAAAASVVLVLGAASAAFWYFSPKEEIKEAFTQAAMTPEANLVQDATQESFPSIHQTAPVAQKPVVRQPAGGGIPAGLTAQADAEEPVSVHVSIILTQRVYADAPQTDDSLYPDGNPVRNGVYRANAGSAEAASEVKDAAVSPKEAASPLAQSAEPRTWALKASVGTSLPKGDYRMPLTAGLSVERVLNKSLSLEAGLQYHRLGGGRTLHALGVPVKLNVALASTPKMDVYATVGGMAEKCVAGLPDNGFRAEPVQLAVTAGMGLRYKMNDRFALFAEPSVSHHFDTDSQSKSLRTERATNLNLLCGVRMTY